MIKKIFHLGDYHIHNNQWHERYNEGNEFIYKKIEEEKPDRILIAGDLFENFVTISNDAKLFAGNFLNKLASYAKVIIVPGNHDIMKRNLLKLNSIETLIKLIDNPNITSYDKSGFFEDDNVIWVNHSHLEKNINPWNDIPHVKDKTKTYIDIWHDPILGCISDNGFEMTSKNLRNISDFKGDFSMFGDIHKYQLWYNVEEMEIDEKDLNNYLNNGWEIK